MKRLIILVATISTVALGRGDAEGMPPSTVAELTALAENGEQQAALSLGMRYRDGKGVARDHKEALKWYRRCADQGDAAGMDNVGFMYLRGWGVEEDFDIAAGYFRAAARKGDDQGLFNLGNCYFSGQGVEQDYARAVDAWKRAAAMNNTNAIWRLAVLHAAGEGVPQDGEMAAQLCERIARKGHVNAMLLLGELAAGQGDGTTARKWWGQAAGRGSTQGEALLTLAKWRDLEPVDGKRAYVAVDHLYQGWNNCGATSIAMFARHAGSDASPYDVKRLCPRSPIGTGTDWADLVASGGRLGQQWKLVTFPHDDAGFDKGVGEIRRQLDANRPVVIDFTVIRKRDGKTERFGHTLLVVGYNSESDQFVLKNPNQPSPGIQLMSGKELKANWYSGGYSRVAKRRVARPLIVVASD